MVGAISECNRIASVEPHPTPGETAWEQSLEYMVTKAGWSDDASWGMKANAAFSRQAAIAAAKESGKSVNREHVRVRAGSSVCRLVPFSEYLS